MTEFKNYSVLMSVYCKEDADFLRDAMDSVWQQTNPTDDFVLVCDGPLTDRLDSVIEEAMREHKDVLNVIRLEKNGGLGNALNYGIKYCRNELVARMDSDDICRPDRCERQLRLFREHPEVSICTGVIEEFIGTKDSVVARRIVPEIHEDIVKFAKKRNPFNHVSAMYKKSAVEEAGGYLDFPFLEDYYLWIRMIQKGFIGYNIQQPLLWVRIGTEMFKRRGGWRYAMEQRSLLRYMRNTGFITVSEYYFNMITRFIVSLVPNGLRKYLYKHFAR